MGSRAAARADLAGRISKLDLVRRHPGLSARPPLGAVLDDRGVRQRLPHAPLVLTTSSWDVGGGETTDLSSWTSRSEARGVSRRFGATNAL